MAVALPLAVFASSPQPAEHSVLGRAFEYGGADGIRDAVLLPDGTGWGVGYRIAHYDGRRWRRHPSSELLQDVSQLEAVDFAGTGSGIAVGDRGFSMRYEAGQWRQLPRHSWSVLRDVVLVSPVEAWAVGSGIWHYQDGAWQEYPVGQPEPPQFTAVAFRGASDGWAVGSQIWRFDGSSWVHSLTASNRLLSAAVDQDGSVWAVGLHGTALRYRAGAWKPVPVPSEDTLTSVGFGPDEYGWIGMSIEPPATRSPLLRWDGDNWSVAEIACLSDRLACPFVGAASQSTLVTRPTAMREIETVAIGRDEGWALGPSGMVVRLASGSATMIHWQQAIRDIDFVTPEQAWGVGEGGLILHRRHGGWERSASPTDRSLVAVKMVSPEEGYAAIGVGGVLRFAGSRWRVDASMPDHFVNDLAVDGSQRVWLLGGEYGSSAGAIFRRGGDGWQLEHTLSQEDTPLLAADFAGDGEGWAVGGNGTIVHYSEDAWQSAASPTTEPLWSVAAVSADNAWAGGYETILHWDGSSWQVREVQDLPAESFIVSLELASPTAGWGLARRPFGNGWSLLGYSSGVWSVVEDALPGTGNRHTLDFLIDSTRLIYDPAQPYFFWIAGQFGAIVRYRWDRTLPPPASRLFLPHLHGGALSGGR